jgi:hypothetical protein
LRAGERHGVIAPSTLQAAPPHLTLAHKLPDLPRWIEVRDLLLAGAGEINGLRQAPDLSFVLHEPETTSTFVVGSPEISAIQAAVQPIMPNANVITPQENAAWLAQALPAWNRTRIIVHQLSGSPILPMEAGDKVRFLDPHLLQQLSIPTELLHELESGAQHSLIAATFVEGQPVSFCYSGSQTESLWDVSIDTLPAYQRKGYAARCAAYMIRHMQAQGKRPVWQAVEENPASWRLNQRSDSCRWMSRTVRPAGTGELTPFIGWEPDPPCHPVRYNTISVRNTVVRAWLAPGHWTRQLSLSL